MHASIGINRAWVAYSISNTFLNSAFIEKSGKIMIWFLPVFALIIALPRCFGHTRHYYTGTGELASIYVEDEIKMVS
uniref:Uncharacterized protein n=1 Tax=Panagrolaimus sp. PS1159 TaxID=55785 RepID=A0AC35F145_9BILA